MADSESTSVRVAVRVRPLSVRERGEFQSSCLTVAPSEPQIIIGTERAFTFDFAFNSETHQNAIFEATTQDLVDGCFTGLNATILAYGQTGSGKTYTMGTGFDVNIPPESLGIIPRAVEHMFRIIHEKQEDALTHDQPAPSFDMWVQFIELYQDDLIDLLDRASRQTKTKRPKQPKLGEDKDGHVILNNVCTKPISSKEEIMDWLKQGALARTTGSTNMNAQSSRSHAIFTIGITQSIQHLPADGAEAEFSTTTAKFHFVDLAGSERLKRTGAVGNRAKESIAINSGLLALGNVICKLGDRSLKATHIPYRSSKLTRLLQDSLGGNSQTLMIACISPAEHDFLETLNTLRYANRTRNIQNKVVVNQDKSSQTINILRARAQELEMMLAEYQQGKRQPGVDAYNDMFIENSTLQKENENLKARLRVVQEESADQQKRNVQLRAEIDRLKEMVGGGGGNGYDAANQNVTDTDKLRSYYCEIIEEKEVLLARAKKDLENFQSLVSSPSVSTRKTYYDSGGKTYRVRKTQILSPAEIPTDGPMEIPDIIHNSDSSDADDAVLETLDEKIWEREKELEQMKQTLSSQRENYELKIQELGKQIAEIEEERTKYLEQNNGLKGITAEQIKERERKYQKELAELRRLLKEQEKNLSDYKKLQNDKVISQLKVEKLSKDIDDLKRMKCETMRKVEQDSKRARARDLQQTRCLTQKEKAYQQMRKDLAEQKILGAQKQVIITRLRADLLAARKAGKVAMSDQVAGRVGKSRVPSDYALKKNWAEFLNYFRAVAYKRMRLKVFEKQLKSYGEELLQLRSAAQRLETKLSFAADKQNLEETELLRQELEDTRSAIHFLEKQNCEIQNEAASCEESPEEYNHVDPIFLRTKFSDEVSIRHFLEHLLELALTQHEEVQILETREQAKSAEYGILIKERNVLREILQFYVDSPDQTKVDITGFARSHLGHVGVQDLTSEEVVNNIRAASAHTFMTLSSQKARQCPLVEPREMLGTSNSDGASTSSGEDYDNRLDGGDKFHISAFSRPVMGPPKIPTIRSLKKSNQSKLPKTPSNKLLVPPMSVNGTTISSSPLKLPNRCGSLNELHDFRNRTHKAGPSPGHSLENVMPSSSPSPKPSPTLFSNRRHACQHNLTVTPKFQGTGRK